MGQRSNPIGLRLGIVGAGDARWYSNNKAEYAARFNQDYQIRTLLKRRFREAGLSRIIIARSLTVDITMYAAKVGLIIGKKGVVIESLKNELDSKFGIDAKINVKEIKQPDTDAQYIADSLAMKMEQRGSFKIHVKRAIQSAMAQGVLGIKIYCKGRLNGTEIARAEEFMEGSVPLQTFRANILYGISTAHTSSGTCSVQVSVYKHDHIKEYNPFEGLQDRISKDFAAEQNRKSVSNLKK